MWSHKKSLAPYFGKCKNSIKPDSLDSLFSLDSVFLVINGRNRYRSVFSILATLFLGQVKMSMLIYISRPIKPILKHRLLGSIPRAADSAGLVWGLQICISIRFSGDAVLVVWGLHFESHWSRHVCQYVCVCLCEYVFILHR